KTAEKMVPEATVSVVLAQCYEASGRLDRAEEFLGKIPPTETNAALLRQVADFYLRTGRPQRAEPYLDNLMMQPVSLQSRADIAWARRNWALQQVFAGSAVPDPKRIQEALELIEKNLREDR